MALPSQVAGSIQRDALAGNQDVARKAAGLGIDERYREQFTGLALETGRGIINSIKENAGDYKTISEDKNMSPVDKALGKRKVLAADIGLGILGTGGALGLVWLTKKVFAA